MKKLLVTILFILGCVSVNFAQVKVPTVDLSANPRTVVGNEVRLKKIEITVDDQGLNKTTIKLFAAIGKTSSTQTDPLTGLYLFETFDSDLVYFGTIEDLLALITKVSTQNDANTFAVNFVKVFYNQQDNSGLVVQFNSLIQTLMNNNALQLKPIVKAQ